MSFIFFFILCNLLFNIFSKSGSYSSTFDFKGGLETKQSWYCSDKPTFKVHLSVTEYEAPKGFDFQIEINLKKKSFFGSQNVDQEKVSLYYGGSATLKGDGEGDYFIYLRQYSGFPVKGNINIDYTC